MDTYVKTYTFLTLLSIAFGNHLYNTTVFENHDLTPHIAVEHF